MTISEMVKEFKIKLDGGNIKVFGKPNANQVKELKANKAAIISFLEEKEVSIKAEIENEKQKYFADADLRKAVTITSDNNGNVKYWLDTVEIINGVAYKARFVKKEEISEKQAKKLSDKGTKMQYGDGFVYIISENTKSDINLLEQQKEEEIIKKEKMYQKREIETKKRNAELAKSGFCEKCNSWCYGDC